MRCVNARQSGNYVASDWEKAVKYTDDTAVENLEIGGRNLLKNSDFTNGITSWGASHSGSLTFPSEGDEIALSCPFKYGKSVKLTQKVGQAWGFISQNVENLEVGETFFILFKRRYENERIF